MRVSSIEIIPVNIPLKAPIRWPWGIRTGITRNIVKVHTDNGLVGYGETMGGTQIENLMKGMVDSVIGSNPFDIELILSKFQLTSYFSGYAGLAATAGIETALWDVMAKSVEKPLYELLGGLYRSKVPFSAYVFYRYPGEDEGGETTPDDIVDYCRKIVSENGFSNIKLKGGVFEPNHDIDTIAAIRKEFGSDMGLRIDPNAVWSPTKALEVSRKLLEYNLEYLEDPTPNLEGMARIRRDVPIPLATNMCVVDFDQIAPAFRLGSVDVILGDTHKWGGILATKKLAAVCETLQFGFSLHSGCELGISTLAYAHVAASTPVLSYAADSHYTHLTDDILKGGLLKFKDGMLEVPDKPGLGAELDEDKLELYAERYKQQGVLPGTGDQFNPNWIPKKVMF
ncbi:enolase C-terminal domain-like protein [Bacillus sp. REN16]|uniref:enolase C-terminal domain-like protein n=1 Tax=Bacillus sp. REN16 TaxID=2887296 RepID=UPI001E2F2DFC|nr:enolase C-terminal domain-like protein [Bacillus sp. REN16]MCC3356772.1 mandelate racemase [Bacillus sp. REN16]